MKLLEKFFSTFIDGETVNDKIAKVGYERPSSKHRGHTKRPRTAVVAKRRAANKVAKASRKANRR